MNEYKDIDDILEIFDAKYVLDALQKYLSSDEWNEFVDFFEKAHDLDYYEEDI